VIVSSAKYRPVVRRLDRNWIWATWRCSFRCCWKQRRLWTSLVALKRTGGPKQENSVEWPGSVPADFCSIIVGYQHNVCPAVVVSDHLERQSESKIRPGNTNHCVVCYSIVESWMAAPLRKERTVPVWQQDPSSFTHCNIIIYTIDIDQNDDKSSRWQHVTILRKFGQLEHGRKLSVCACARFKSGSTVRSSRLEWTSAVRV